MRVFDSKTKSCDKLYLWSSTSDKIPQAPNAIPADYVCQIKVQSWNKINQIRIPQSFHSLSWIRDRMPNNLNLPRK